jgi:hypothetical protein
VAVTALRAVWRALPGDVIGRAALRLARVPVTRLGRWLDAIPRTPTAMTFGRVVLAREPLSDALVAHEAEHVRQWTALGPLYLPAYLAASAEAALRGGDRYRANRFEAAAFAAGEHAAARPAPVGSEAAGSPPAGAARDG